MRHVVLPDRVGDAVLLEIVADGELAAEGIPSLSRWRTRRSCPATHGRRPARRGRSSLTESATARSSPKLGRVTRMPSILSLLSWKSFAHFSASFHVITTPSGVSLGVSDDEVDVFLLQERDHLLAPLLCKLGGKHVPVADDESKGYLPHSASIRVRKSPRRPIYLIS